jgi:hypothetical protein
VGEFEWDSKEFVNPRTKPGDMLGTIATCETVWKHAVGCCIAISAWVQCSCNDGRQERNMDRVTPPLAVETEALSKAYAAFNRNDIPATVEALDPQIEWTEPFRVSRRRDLSWTRRSEGVLVAVARGLGRST